VIEEKVVDLLVVEIQDMNVIMKDLIWTAMILQDMIATKGTVMIVMIVMTVTTVVMIVVMIAMNVALHHQDMILIPLVQDHLIKRRRKKWRGRIICK
jgi:hypothetical protein